uniref:Uncharacterized protein n=1 Tax=Aegilops tauschii subsp. strangulata TaxID=200361 RepID=A0A453BI94_AEGTS
PSVYNNNDEFDAMNNSTDAKTQAQMDEIKAHIKSYKRSSSSSRRRSSTHASELPSPARSHRHRHHHQQEREGQELNTNNRSMTSPSPLASSPTDIRHLRLRIRPVRSFTTLPILEYPDLRFIEMKRASLFQREAMKTGKKKKVENMSDVAEEQTGEVVCMLIVFEEQTEEPTLSMSNVTIEQTEDVSPPVYDFSRLKHDPGERLPIASYPVNDQDTVRRAYILKKLFKPYAHDFKKEQLGVENVYNQSADESCAKGYHI